VDDKVNEKAGKDEEDYVGGKMRRKLKRGWKQAQRTDFRPLNRWAFVENSDMVIRV
jgi:hypothetical protein